jgi:hypothetical protein
MAILNMIPWPMGRKLQWLELTLAALAGAKRYSHKERKKNKWSFSSRFPPNIHPWFLSSPILLG